MAFDIEGARKEGYSDTEIADHLAQGRGFDIKAARAEGYADADIISHLSQAQAKDLPKYDRKPDSVIKRVGMGIAEPFVGAVQAMKHVAEVPGMTSAPFGIGPLASVMKLTGSAEDYDATAADLAATQQQGAPEGIDWARIGGNVIGLAPTVLAGGNPTGLMGAAGAGARLGAVGAAVTPTEGGEVFGLRKAGQIATGAAVGAVASPIAQAGLQGLGAVGAAVVNAVRRNLAPSATPQQIQITVNNAIQSAGIDPSRLPPEFLRQVTAQARQAMSVGGTLNPDQLANAATFARLNLNPTRGQVSQDPMQFGNELFLRGAPGGEDVASQYVNVLQGLNQNVRQLQGGASPAVLPVDAGQRVINTLSAADARGNQLVNNLYGQARNEAGVTTPINGAAMSQGIVNRLEQAMLGDKLPAAFSGVMNQLATGTRELDIRTGEQIMRAVNGRIGQTNDRAERAALGIFRDELQSAIESSGSAQGNQAAAAFRTARGAAAQRFQLHEAIPALRAVVDGDIAPDDFMRRFVYGANRDDFQRLGQFVQQASPESWQQIRGQILDDLSRAANPTQDGQTFSDAAFGKALRSLQQSGKLPILFSAPEIEQLNAIARAAHLSVAGPAGVSRTGMGGAAKLGSLMARVLGGVPLLGRAAGMAQGLAQQGGNTLQATAALSPAPLTQIPLRNVIPETARNRLSVGAGVGMIPLLNELSQ